MKSLENHMVIGDYYDESASEPRDCRECHSELADDEGLHMDWRADLCDECIAFEREKDAVMDILHEVIEAPLNAVTIGEMR